MGLTWGLIDDNNLSIDFVVVFQNFIQKMEIFLVGLERKKVKEKKILLMGVTSQEYLLTCCKPPSLS
jgi:hypothetical protein